MLLSGAIIEMGLKATSSYFQFTGSLGNRDAL